MKTFKQFINENIGDDALRSVVNELQSGIDKILGADFVVKVGVSKLGGSPSIFVDVYGASPANGIRQNSPTWMTFWMHRINPEGLNSWTCDNADGDLRFRKITGKSLEDANKKLFDWLKKVKPKMVELEKNKK